MHTKHTTELIKCILRPVTVIKLIQLDEFKEIVINHYKYAIPCAKANAGRKTITGNSKYVLMTKFAVVISRTTLLKRISKYCINVKEFQNKRKNTIF